MAQINTTIWGIIEGNLIFFLQGLGVTLLLAIVGTLGGGLISLLFVAGRTARVDWKRDNPGQIIGKKTASGVILTYVTIFRGTPMILQAMIFFFGLNMIPGVSLTPLQVGIMTVVLNTTAYITEILRGAVNGIDSGQMEAARSLGFSRFKALLLFVYPQAIKNAVPAIVSEFIVNLKDTAVLSVIGVIDLFRTAQIIFNSPQGGAAFRLEVFVIAGLLYLFLTTITTFVQIGIERKQSSEVRLNA